MARQAAPTSLTIAPALRRLLVAGAIALPLSGCMDAAVTSAVVGTSAAKSAQNGAAALEKANAAAATLATRRPAEPLEQKP
jgi:hypothetical protein